MDTKICKLYNEEDIEILNNGISINGVFFSKHKIADTFNELILMNNFIEGKCTNE